MFRGIRGLALALVAVAGCTVIGPDHTPPLCGGPEPIWAISQHSMTYLSCFDHGYAWDIAGVRHRGRSSDTSVVTVTNKIPDQRRTLALETQVTRCDAEPIPGVEGATQLAMDAWGKSNANLKILNLTGVAGRDTVMHVFMESMGAFTRAEWSVKAAGGPMPREPVQCDLTFDFEIHGSVPQIEGY